MMRTSSFKLTRKNIIRILLLILLVPLLIYIVIRPGREYGAAHAVNMLYQKPVQSKTNQFFRPLNAELSALGIKFSATHSTCLSGISDSGDAKYHLWHLTVECNAGTTSEPIAITAELRDQWKMMVPNIHKNLLADGWVEEGNYSSAFHLEEVLEKPYDGYAINTAYSKQDGKYRCDLDFDASGATHLVVSKSCTRDVSFFGGY
jgi:hypothetical protein